MMSDDEYDGFNYNSSQNSLDIDYQIELFEFHRCFKSRKSKQKLRKSPCPISVKTLKAQPKLLKINCMSDKKTPKAELKPFRYPHYRSNCTIFECDKLYQKNSSMLSNSISTRSSKQLINNRQDQPSNSEKILENKHLQNFSSFRQHFYYVNRQKIKTSLTTNPYFAIVDIRLAKVNQSVQNDFMERLNKNTSYFPHLVYHGTKLQNMESILHYGFLIPKQAHPSNHEAPIISSAHGRAYGTGIYSTYSATLSLSYVNATNTLFACAAIPNRNNNGKVERSYGSILVLSHESQIIPLFLIDFINRRKLSTNCPWFDKENDLKINKNKEIKRSTIISRKYLRKVLNCMNNQVRQNYRYQVRSFELFS